MLLNEFEVSSASSCVSVTASSWRMWSFLSPCSSSRWLNPSGHKSSLEKCVHVFEKTLKVQFQKFHKLSFFSLLRGLEEWGLLRSHHGVCHYDTHSLCVNSITAVCPSLSLSSPSHTYSQAHRVTLKICSCGVHHKVCGFHHHLNQAEEKKTSTVRVNTPTSSRTYVLHAGLSSRHLSDFIGSDQPAEKSKNSHTSGFNKQLSSPPPQHFLMENTSTEW